MTPGSDSALLRARIVAELLQVVTEEKVFALKGGTAINFFYHNLPRLSVDIDLTYLPLEDRKDSLSGIRDALSRIRIGLPCAIFRWQNPKAAGISQQCARQGRSLTSGERHGPSAYLDGNGSSS